MPVRITSGRLGDAAMTCLKSYGTASSDAEHDAESIRAVEIESSY